MQIHIGNSVTSPKKDFLNYRESVTKSISTQEQYANIVKNMMMQIELSGGNPDIENIVLLMERKSSKLSRSTVRLYRSAIIAHIDKLFGENILDGKDANMAKSLLKAIKGGVKKSGVSSALKSKKASESAIEGLLAKLDESRSSIALLAKNIFLSSIYVGLRPTEWMTASINNNTLMVKNAKSTNGRGNGECREIILSDERLKLDSKKIEVIVTTIRLIEKALASRQSKKRASSLTDDIQQLIYRCRLVRGSRNITIYSARHQFAANMKASGLNKRDIANLMGHASPDTASRHYGRAVSGHQGFKRAPDTHDTPSAKENSKEMKGPHE